MQRSATMLCITLAAGMRDASEAAAWDPRHCVIAGDEDDTLRLVERGPSQARATLPLRAFLRSRKDEADLEAAIW